MRTRHGAAGHLTPTSRRCCTSGRYRGASGASSAFHFAWDTQEHMCCESRLPSPRAGQVCWSALEHSIRVLVPRELAAKVADIAFKRGRQDRMSRRPAAMTGGVGLSGTCLKRHSRAQQVLPPGLGGGGRLGLQLQVEAQQRGGDKQRDLHLCKCSPWAPEPAPLTRSESCFLCRRLQITPVHGPEHVTGAACTGQA